MSYYSLPINLTHIPLPPITPSEGSTPWATYGMSYHSQPPLVPALHFETANQLLLYIGHNGHTNTNLLTTQEAQIALAASSYAPTPSLPTTVTARHSTLGLTDLTIPDFAQLAPGNMTLLAALNGAPLHVSSPTTHVPMGSLIPVTLITSTPIPTLISATLLDWLVKAQVDFHSDARLQHEAAQEIVWWVISTFVSHPHNTAWGLIWAESICLAICDEHCNEDALCNAAKELGFDLVPLESNEPTPKRARPMEASTTGRKCTCSGSLPPLFASTPHVTGAKVSAESFDGLLQEVEDGDVAKVSRMPPSSVPPFEGEVVTGLTPIPDTDPVVVACDKPMAVIPLSPPKADGANIVPVPSASVQGPMAELTPIECALLVLTAGLNNVNDTLSSFAEVHRH
jgi:hypothetical protein